MKTIYLLSLYYTPYRVCVKSFSVPLIELFFFARLPTRTTSTGIGVERGGHDFEPRFASLKARPLCWRFIAYTDVTPDAIPAPVILDY